MSEADDSLQFLIIEDDRDTLEVYRKRLEIYCLERHLSPRLIESLDVEDASKRIGSENYDGVIVDLRLPYYKHDITHEDGGKQVIDLINKQCLRIPVAVMTGTPKNSIPSSLSQVKTFIKSTVLFDVILDWLYQVNKTGLTKIFGRNGELEDALNAVYRNSLWPQLNVWIGYAQSSALDAEEQTEKALLRLVLDHVLERLENDTDACIPEEAYIFPPSKPELRTGSIVQKKDDNSFHIVLNPACDLVMREHTGGVGEKKKSCKADKILLAEIDQSLWFDADKLRNRDAVEQKKTLKKSLSDSRKPLDVHWLPPTAFFTGGFINFGKLSTVGTEQFEDQYEKPLVQMSPHFVKDVQARFSSYYGRQGQPEIACEKIFDSIIASLLERSQGL